MHFFYLDESGDTGHDLQNPEQPIMVLGGISISDKKWNKTQTEFARIISDYFNEEIPDDFELHSTELLSPNGDGPFHGHSMENRTDLAKKLLKTLAPKGHSIHYIGFDKRQISEITCGATLSFNPSRPYELGFDYLITYINWFLKKNRGSSARGLIILDEKRDQYDNIERILYNRRFETMKSHRVKWIVEFGYPIDSKKNPMIQLSDLVVYCTRKFLEIENGYRNNWGKEAKDFYGQCYNIIADRIAKKSLVPRGERSDAIQRLNEYLGEVRSTPRTQWRRHYNL
ncbi:MAG: DUF3800 domain-containing protein [Candidatus Woesearchaeota archaeon]